MSADWKINVRLDSPADQISGCGNLATKDLLIFQSLQSLVLRSPCKGKCLVKAMKVKIVGNCLFMVLKKFQHLHK